MGYAGVAARALLSERDISSAPSQQTFPSNSVMLGGIRKPDDTD